MTRTSGKRAARLPYSIWLHISVGLLSVSLMQAQAHAQIGSAQELYARAIDAASGDAESRAEMLYGALKKAERSDLSMAQRRELITKITAALGEVDPRSEDRLKAQDRASRKALESSLEYAKTGWFILSEELLELAQRLNPSLDLKAVEEIRALLPEPNAFLHQAFKDATMPYSGDVWTIDSTGITTPAPQGRGQDRTTMLLSSHKFAGDYRIDIEVLSSTPSASYGLAFGCSAEAGSYHLLNVINDGENSRLSFEAFKAGKFTNLAVHPIAISAEEWANWIPITLHVRQGQISAEIAGSAPLILSTETNHDGALGLFLAAKNGNSKATTFRHLKASKED